MKIGIVSNYYKDPKAEMLERVKAYFLKNGCDVQIDRQQEEREPKAGTEKAIDFSQIELMVSIGGDGTFLNAVHAMHRRQVPIVGINLGSVGFLTEIRPHALEQGLARLLRREYSIEERTLLDVRCTCADGRLKFSELALNEALLSRGAAPRIIPVKLYFDGQYIEDIRCDGLLVATPTGSTGYAMAAGGPIVHPDLELLAITPICPYSLHNRSYLLNPDTIVNLELSPYPAHALLSVDGRSEVQFDQGDKVTVSIAKEKLQRIRLHEGNFFVDLPDKLRGRAYTGQHSAEQETAGV